MRLTLARCSLLAAMLLPSPLLAAGNHQHGSGLLQLVLADHGFAAELTLPAADLVGFEHQPRNDGERAALSLAIALLETPDAVLTASKAAGCSASLLAVESPLLTAATTKQPAGAEQHDDHQAHAQHADDGHGHDDATAQAHNDVLARYRYSCSNMQALTAIDLQLFQQLKGLQRVELQWLSANSSGSSQLTPQAPRFSWP